MLAKELGQSGLINGVLINVTTYATTTAEYAVVLPQEIILREVSRTQACCCKSKHVTFVALKLVPQIDESLVGLVKDDQDSGF